MFLESFCTETAEVWKVIGKFITLFKIVIPVILVIIGVVTLGKAVINDDDKDIKAATTKLVKKVIVAIVIFFIPTIIQAIFNLVYPSGKDGHPDYVTCIKNLA
jgi:fumarate reductase subunit D